MIIALMSSYGLTGYLVGTRLHLVALHSGTSYGLQIGNRRHKYACGCGSCGFTEAHAATIALKAKELGATSIVIRDSGVSELGSLPVEDPSDVKGKVNYQYEEQGVFISQQSSCGYRS